MHPFIALLLSLACMAFTYLTWAFESYTRMFEGHAMCLNEGKTAALKLLFGTIALTLLYFAGRGWGAWT